ncbi:MAG: hypothetical protein ACI8WT_000748 [Clostridium sp.]|jgi:hypothetical protein
MNRFKKILALTLSLGIISIPVMAQDYDVPEFSVLIGENCYALTYANDIKNESTIISSVIENKGDIYIQTTKDNWISNLTSLPVLKSKIKEITVKTFNGVVIKNEEIVDEPVEKESDTEVPVNSGGGAGRGGDSTSFYDYSATDAGINTLIESMNLSRFNSKTFDLDVPETVLASNLELSFQSQILNSLTLGNSNPESIIKIKNSSDSRVRYRIIMENDINESPIAISIMGVYMGNNSSKTKSISIVKELVIPTDNELKIDILIEEFKNLVTVNKLNERAFSIKIPKNIEIGNSRLVYYDRILNNITVGGLEPVSVYDISDIYDLNYNTFRVNMEESITPTSTAILINNVCLDSNTSILGDIHLVSIIKEVVIDTTELRNDLVKLEESLVIRSESDKSYSINVLANIGSDNKELVYEEQLLSTLTVDGVKPLSIEKIESLDNRYNVYNIILLGVPISSDIRLNIKNLYKSDNLETTKDLEITTTILGLK